MKRISFLWLVLIISCGEHINEPEPVSVNLFSEEFSVRRGDTRYFDEPPMVRVGYWDPLLIIDTWDIATDRGIEIRLDTRYVKQKKLRIKTKLYINSVVVYQMEDYVLTIEDPNEYQVKLKLEGIIR